MLLYYLKKGLGRLLDKIVYPVLGIAMISLIAYAIVVGIISWRKETEALDECHRYTIGYATEVKRKTLYYRYSTEGGNFNGSWGQKPRSWKDYFKGNFVANKFLYKRFLIKYSCKDHKISQIDWSHSIPETVERALYEGWENIPSHLPRNKF